MDNLNQFQPQEIPQDPSMIPQEPIIDEQNMEQPPIRENSPNSVQDGNPYFMGDYALIKFSTGEEVFGPATYWLVDKSNHTIRPFESHMALDTAFGEDLQDALQNAMTIVPPQIDQSGNITDGVLADFSILGPEYAIKEDGTSKPLDFSPHQLKKRYGKPINENLEGLSTEAVDGLLGLLKKNESKTKIPAKFINELKNNQQLMAFYISAMAYGDYSLNDLYADIHRRYYNSKE
jgi:hypothetical protein